MLEHQPTLVADLDDDFADLDEIIAREEERKRGAKSITAKRNKLHKAGFADPVERARIQSELEAWDSIHVWETVEAVALFHSQTCASCGHQHRFFMGWMTSQRHRTDPNCRRLLRGKPLETLPERVEEHAQGTAEMCGDCAESQLTVNSIMRGLDPKVQI